MYYNYVGVDISVIHNTVHNIKTQKTNFFL